MNPELGISIREREADCGYQSRPCCHIGSFGLYFERSWRWHQFCLSYNYPPRKRREIGSLGSLYARLHKCVDNVLRYVGKYDVVTHADTCFTNFLWERFGAIAPKYFEYSVVAMVETIVDGVKWSEQNTPYKPSALRWVRVKQANNKSLVKAINDENCFNVHPFVYT